MISHLSNILHEAAGIPGPTSAISINTGLNESPSCCEFLKYSRQPSAARALDIHNRNGRTQSLVTHCCLQCLPTPGMCTVPVSRPHSWVQNISQSVSHDEISEKPSACAGRLKDYEELCGNIEQARVARRRIPVSLELSRA
jgi:hypothetical protein